MAAHRAQRFPNIENHALRGRRLFGWTPTDRVFRITCGAKRDCATVWRAKAVSLREGLVNELVGQSLMDISNKLRETE